MNLFFTFLDLQSLGVSPQNVFKSANLVSLTKSANKNDQNLAKKFVAANFENDIGAVVVLGEKFRRTVFFWGDEVWLFDGESQLPWEHFDGYKSSLSDSEKTKLMLWLFHIRPDCWIVKSSSRCSLLPIKRRWSKNGEAAL